MLQRVFLEHPATVNETYFEHLGRAWGFAGRLAIAAFMCFVHGLLPCCFTTSASQSVNRLHEIMVTHRRVNAD